MILLKVFKSSRKVQGFGSSLAVTLPALFVKACDINKGANLEVVYGLNGVLVISDCSDPKRIQENVQSIFQELEAEKLEEGESKNHAR